MRTKRSFISLMRVIHILLGEFPQMHKFRTCYLSAVIFLYLGLALLAKGQKRLTSVAQITLSQILIVKKTKKRCNFLIKKSPNNSLYTSRLLVYEGRKYYRIWNIKTSEQGGDTEPRYNTKCPSCTSPRSPQLTRSFKN